MDTRILKGIFFLINICPLLTYFPTFSVAMAGGEIAHRGEFPHAVQLTKKTGGFLCGGNIIAPNVVITAAHCLYNWTTLATLDLEIIPADMMLVTAGRLKLKENAKDVKGKEQTRAVARYVTHLNDDIALLILKERFNYTETVGPIQLPSSASQIYSSGVFSGWGMTDGRYVYSPQLKKINVVLEDKNYCKDNYICAKFTKGTGPCKGDSGGSVVCQEKRYLRNELNGTDTIFFPISCGVLSRTNSSPPCGTNDSVGLFMDVTKFLDWIQNTINESVDKDEITENNFKSKNIEWIGFFSFILISLSGMLLWMGLYCRAYIESLIIWIK